MKKYGNLLKDLQKKFNFNLSIKSKYIDRIENKEVKENTLKDKIVLMLFLTLFLGLTISPLKRLGKVETVVKEFVEKTKLTSSIFLAILIAMFVVSIVFVVAYINYEVAGNEKPKKKKQKEDQFSDVLLRPNTLKKVFTDFIKTKNKLKKVLKLLKNEITTSVIEIFLLTSLDPKGLSFLVILTGFILRAIEYLIVSIKYKNNNKINTQIIKKKKKGNILQLTEVSVERKYSRFFFYRTILTTIVKFAFTLIKYYLLWTESNTSISNYLEAIVYMSIFIGFIAYAFILTFGLVMLAMFSDNKNISVSEYKEIEFLSSQIGLLVFIMSILFVDLLLNQEIGTSFIIILMVIFLEILSSILSKKLEITFKEKRIKNKDKTLITTKYVFLNLNKRELINKLSKKKNLNFKKEYLLIGNIYNSSKIDLLKARNYITNTKNRRKKIKKRR